MKAKENSLLFLPWATIHKGERKISYSDSWRKWRITSLWFLPIKVLLSTLHFIIMLNIFMKSQALRPFWSCYRTETNASTLLSPCFWKPH